MQNRVLNPNPNPSERVPASPAKASMHAEHLGSMEVLRRARGDWRKTPQNW